jgi:hypothetical protein
MSDTHTAFVVLQNTDLTEGRGGVIPIAICESKATALRLGKGNDVQGSDCKIEEITLQRVGYHWYGPVYVHAPTKEDTALDVARNKRDAAIAKAKELGLSEQDIKDLYSSISIV